MTEYICPFCKKSYMRKYPFYNHKLICELAHKKKTTNDCDYKLINNGIGIDEKVPSNTELFEFILTLYDKYETLQKDYTILKSFINNAKQKLNIIDWLNKNSIVTDYGFNDVFMKATITKEHLVMVFEHDYINGIFAILNDLIENNPCAGNTIKSFVQKENTIYILAQCDNCEGGNGKGLIWKKMTNDEFDELIKYITCKLLLLFQEWNDEVEVTMKPDKYTELYIKNLKCLFGGNFRSCDKNVRIKNKLYRAIRENLKYVSEFI
jgi:hypothetical protein